MSKQDRTFVPAMAITDPQAQDDIVQQEILAVALRLFRKYGPNKVTMDDVAQATGRSRSSLYYYYKNRDDIFMAVLDMICLEVAGKIRHAVAQASTLNEKIFAFCTSKIQTSLDWKSVFSAMWSSMDADEKSKHTRVMDALHKKLVHTEAMILNEILAEAAGKQEIRNITPAEQDMLVFLVSSSIRGLRREVLDQNDPHDLRAAMQLLTDMITGWLKGKEPV